MPIALYCWRCVSLSVPASQGGWWRLTLDQDSSLTGGLAVVVSSHHSVLSSVISCASIKKQMGLKAMKYIQIFVFQRRLVAFCQEIYSISTLAVAKFSSTGSVSLIGTVPPDSVWRDAACIYFLRAARPKMRSKWRDCANNSTCASLPGGCKKVLGSLSDEFRCGYGCSSAVVSSLWLRNDSWLCFSVWSWRCAGHSLVSEENDQLLPLSTAV